MDAEGTGKMVMDLTILSLQPCMFPAVNRIVYTMGVVPVLFKVQEGFTELVTTWTKFAPENRRQVRLITWDLFEGYPLREESTTVKL